LTRLRSLAACLFHFLESIVRSLLR
jgi:hypothetical protein